MSELINGGAATAPDVTHAGPVMVVEDVPLIRQAWVNWLKLEGWIPIEAASADEAMAAAAAHSPVVAVCDVSLGSGKSGVWLANELLGSSNSPQIVYATSHMTLPGDATLRPGVSAYLLKPFGCRQLVSAVAMAETELLARRRRVSAEQALRAELAQRRAQLHRRIDNLDPTERLDPFAIVARLLPFRLDAREEHVPALAERAGARLGLTWSEQHTLRRAVVLRGLGKAVMPDALLNPERPLLEFERRILRSWVSEGEAAVARCGFEKEAEWVGGMADRWDGLDNWQACGRQRPSAGPSLLRAINDFLALTADRQCQPCFSMVEGIDQLRRGAGSLYDPAAVTALIDTLTTQQ